MKYFDEFRKKEQILAIAGEIRRISKKEIVLMEVCGGHTLAIRRFGLTSLLPPGIRLLSGPGCPVCVSGQHFIDTALAYTANPEVIIVTYGDLIRVPGSVTSLEKMRAKGGDIRVIYSVTEALAIARNNPDRKVIFPGIGFETTSPATAAALVQARDEDVTNFFVLSAHKIMPPAMNFLVAEGVKLDGFIAPGHVTAITGTDVYNTLADSHGLGVVVAGFEPTDLMMAILMLVKQAESGLAKVEIQYRRVVTKEGNKIAQRLLSKVFEPHDDTWRGLGMIAGSGLKLGPGFSLFDAEKRFPISIPDSSEPRGCICGQILRGLKTPEDCTLFGKKCTPSEPVGACMVSTEGTCATYFRYRQ